MSRSPQDVYARYLLSSRGYPLWIPEPSHQLLLYRPDGLRIGDVGVVVPEDATGVPNDFKHVELRDEDIRIIPYVENPGRIISTSSVTKIRKVEPPSDTPGTQLGGLGYEFDLSSSGGALLILPEGAERYDLRNRRLFFDEATRHGTDWYRFAEEHLGRMISHDSLYLITGFYKARSWSLAAFENVAGSGEFSAQFKMAQVGGNIVGDCTWETTRALDWRVGPVENYGIPNQSVFIRGFKIALRTDFLGKRRIEVKADAPDTRSKHEKFPRDLKRDSWISRVWRGFSGSRPGPDMRDEAVVGPTTDKASDDSPSGGTPDDAGNHVHVVIQPMPELPQNFHPSDIINQYLFTKGGSADVAITHDDDWIAILEKGKLKPEDLVQANPFRVGEIVSNMFHIVSREDVVFLQEKSDADANNVDQPPVPPSVRRQDMEEKNFNPPSDVKAPLPEYRMDSPDRSRSMDVEKKSHWLADSLHVPVSTQSLGIHWLLRQYDPRTSKHLLRFDIILPVDQICYQRSDNVRERLTDEDLDKPASNQLVTKMTITFEQWPFGWTIDVDNTKGIRCRDVFEAIYNTFNQQLTLGELWRVPDRRACEEAFRIRNIVLGSPQIERSLGWKRVDVLLHHTIFLGLTMNSRGDWVLNLGAPLPVSNLPLSRTHSRRGSSSTSEESAEKSDGYAAQSIGTTSPKGDSPPKLGPPTPARNLRHSPALSRRGSSSTSEESAERSDGYAAQSIGTTSPKGDSPPKLGPPTPARNLALWPRQQIVQSRPIHRPLGPRAHRPKL